MIFTTPVKFLSAIATTLLIGLFAPVAAAAPPQVKSIAADIPMEQRMEALHEVGNKSCPIEFEYSIPGVYYYCVGTRYMANGDNDRARAMLEIAASWGSKPAAFTLGVAYYNGDVQPLDHVRGLAWLAIAAERQNAAYAAVFKSAWNKATPQERQRGNSLWQEMLPTYGDQRAGRRAERRYRNERSRIMTSADGATICMGITDTGSHEKRDPDQAAGHDKQSVDCEARQVVFVVREMDAKVEHLLSGWTGHVTVGVLQQAPAPSK